MKRVDITGKKFGRLEVLECLGARLVGETKKRKRVYYLCKCDCGNLVEKRGEAVRGGTLSCGCYHNEVTASINYKHGLSKSGEHRIWSHMKNRCINANDKKYHDYGGRGIEVCDRWRDSFEDFLSDMGMRPSQKHSIDRIDVNGNYEPGNCRWATSKEQCINKRNTFYAEYNDEVLPLKTWCERLGLDYKQAHKKIIRKKLTLKEIVNGQLPAID